MPGQFGNVVIAIAKPSVDQRRLIKSYRYWGPATAFITTENATLTMICGNVAIAQITSTMGTIYSCGTKKGMMPVAA